MTNDDLYIAWLNAGADCAGLKFSDFIKHLPPRQPVDTEALAAELRNALAWGMAFGPVIPENQWHKERDAQVSAALARLAAPPPRQPEQQPEPLTDGYYVMQVDGTTTNIWPMTDDQALMVAAHGIKGEA